MFELSFNVIESNFPVSLNPRISDQTIQMKFLILGVIGDIMDKLIKKFQIEVGKLFSLYKNILGKKENF